MPDRLDGKVAVVTGGGAGQGAAVAGAFAAEGAAVAIVDIDVGAGESTAQLIRDGGGVARFIEGDVSEEKSWTRIAGEVEAELGDIAVAYHNAALFSPDDGSVVDLAPDVWDRVMAVNARSVYLGCRAVVPSMIRRGGGSIIAVASIRAHLGTSAPQDAYAASKGAVVALIRSLAVHLAPHSIRANVISPGTILTAMAPVADEAAAAIRRARYPMGRFGTVDDVTGAAVHLASDESSWTTGVEITIDGGTSSFYV